MTSMGMVTAPQICGPTRARGDQLCDDKKARQPRRRGLRSNARNFAIFAAILRASSRVSSFAADRRPGSSLKYKLLAVVVAHDEVGVLFLNSPRWWKAAGH
jgi:hypothetical protein